MLWITHFFLFFNNNNKNIIYNGTVSFYEMALDTWERQEKENVLPLECSTKASQVDNWN